MIQEIYIKPRRAGIEITKKGVFPVKAATKSSFVDLFRLYELSPEEVQNLYGHLLEYQSGNGCYVLHGFASAVTAGTLNALFLSTFEFFKGCESLVITKRDYLDDNEAIFDMLQALNVKVKYVVPESLAYMAFLCYENKLPDGSATVLNLKGGKAVVTLYKVESGSGDSEEQACRRFKISMEKKEIVDCICDDDIRGIIVRNVCRTRSRCSSRSWHNPEALSWRA